ncbi:hypothetical protein ENHAE0001_0012 [Enhydrobacter aerosaccus SK60]|nr:hypothetical protein ENHAE0001_0012 [Enhydrobacter aerosaccus SK60]
MHHYFYTLPATMTSEFNTDWMSASFWLFCPVNLFINP